MKTDLESICHGCCSWSRVLRRVARRRTDGDLLAGRTWGNSYGCDFYNFSLWAGSTRHDREGRSCPVLYSDLLRAIGTPVPLETSKWGSPIRWLATDGF